MAEQESRMAKKRIQKQEIHENSQEKSAKKMKRSGRRRRKERLRVIPIWLRIIIGIVLIGGSLLLGLMFGYGVIGDGEPANALNPDTWYHMIDIIRGR